MSDSINLPQRYRKGEVPPPSEISYREHPLEPFDTDHINSLSLEINGLGIANIREQSDSSSTAVRPLSSSRSKILPSDEADKAVLLLFTRTCTWIQGSARNALHLLSLGLQSGTAFVVGALVGSFAALGTYAFLAGASFYDGIVLLTEGNRWAAAKQFFASSGATAGAISALNMALTAIKETWNVAGPFLVAHAGMIAGAALAGLGPLITSVLDSLKLSDQIKQLKIFEDVIGQLNQINDVKMTDLASAKKQLNEVIKKHPDAKVSAELSKMKVDEMDLKAIKTLSQELKVNAESRLKEINHQKLVTIGKIVGAVAIGALQIALAIGTGGVSVGIMLAITGGYLLASYLVDMASTKESKKNLEVFVEQLKSVPPEMPHEASI
jgi:hypothetical protein